MTPAAYWTLLVITLGEPWTGNVGVVPYMTMTECGAAMEIVRATMGGAKIELMQCQESGVRSDLPPPEESP